MELDGTKTYENLKAAFAGESQANRRYLYFARQADIEGYPEAAGVFKNTADGETGHAFGHLEFLSEVGDPATGKPIGSTDINLEAAIITPDIDIIPGANTYAPAYLVFSNYEKVLNWNRSLRFALAVCTLKNNFKNEI